MAKRDTRKYRNADSYRGKTPEARERQVANLKRGNSTRDPGKQWREEMAEVRGWSVIELAEKGLGLDFSQRPAQKVILKVIDGIPLEGDEERKICQQLTAGEREASPVGGVTEVVAALGARSGKSFSIASVKAIHEAVCKGHIWREYLRPGEYGYAMIVATRQKQADDIIVANCGQLLRNSKILSRFLDGEPTKSEITLTNGLKIASLPCNSRAGRGLPIFYLAFDEIAHFFTEGARADVDIYRSLSPRMVQFPGAKIIYISTPAAEQGIFWDRFNEGYLVPGRATFRAPTWVINPLVDEEFLERERRNDPENFAREFAAEFAKQISAYFSADKLADCFTLAGDTPVQVGQQYIMGMDQSGAVGKDRFGIAVAHQEVDGRVYVDAARAIDTTEMAEALGEVGRLAEEYGIKLAVIDSYSAGWVRPRLAEMGLQVETRPGLPVVFKSLKTLMVGGQLHLPEDGELKKGLENTKASYGKNNTMSIYHDRTATGAHADKADAVATAVWRASSKERSVYPFFQTGTLAGIGPY